jgi:hypothetical protein
MTIFISLVAGFILGKLVTKEGVQKVVGFVKGL